MALGSSRPRAEYGAAAIWLSRSARSQEGSPWSWVVSQGFIIGAAAIALRIGNARAAAPLVLAPSAAAPEHADT